MTEKSQPGLGSGALRELLAKYRRSQENTRGMDFASSIFKRFADELEAALSLSSPIEPPPQGVQTLARCICTDDAYAAREGWDKNCPVHGTPILQASLAPRGSKKS